QPAGGDQGEVQAAAVGGRQGGDDGGDLAGRARRRRGGGGLVAVADLSRADRRSGVRVGGRLRGEGCRRTGGHRGGGRPGGDRGRVVGRRRRERSVGRAGGGGDLGQVEGRSGFRFGTDPDLTERQGASHRPPTGNVGGPGNPQGGRRDRRRRLDRRDVAELDPRPRQHLVQSSDVEGRRHRLVGDDQSLLGQSHGLAGDRDRRDRRGGFLDGRAPRPDGEAGERGDASEAQ